MEKLAQNGARMVIISNSSRRASTTLEKVDALGFDASLFAGAITSGELTHQYLERLQVGFPMNSFISFGILLFFGYLAFLGLFPFIVIELEMDGGISLL